MVVASIITKEIIYDMAPRMVYCEIDTMTIPPIYNATRGQRSQNGDRTPTERTPFFGERGDRSATQRFGINYSVCGLFSYAEPREHGFQHVGAGNRTGNLA